MHERPGNALTSVGFIAGITLCSQMVSEKVGGAEGTKLDEDFKDLERVTYIHFKKKSIQNLWNINISFWFSESLMLVKHYRRLTAQNMHTCIDYCLSL